LTKKDIRTGKTSNRRKSKVRGGGEKFSKTNERKSILWTQTSTEKVAKKTGTKDNQDVVLQ